MTNNESSRLLDYFEFLHRLRHSNARGVMGPKLDHFIFEWEVVNFFMWNMDRELRSPVFQVRTRCVCKWQLELWPLLHDGQRALSIRLRMYSSTSDTVIVNFKISGINHMKDFWHVEKNRHTFKNEDVWVSSVTPTFTDARGALGDNNLLEEKIWTIECELLYVDGFSSRPLPPISHVWKSVKELSPDLLKCLDDEDYKDVKLNTKDGTYGAHRAILYARHPSFIPKLGDPKWLEKTKAEDQQQLHTISLDLEEVDGEVLQAALKFSYTGEMEALETGNPPPIGLYEYAEKQGLDDLKRSLGRCRSTGQSVLKTSATQLFFEIEKHKALTTDGFPFRLSSITGCKNFTWRLDGIWVNQNSEPNSRTLMLCLYPMGANQVLKVELELCIINLDGTYSHTKRVSSTVVVGSGVQVDSVIDESIFRSELSSLMSGDIFNIYCLVTYSTGEVNTFIKIPNIFNFSPQTEGNLIRLHNDMRKLFEEGFFSDAFLITNEGIYLVHRFLLSARSVYFASQFNQKLSLDKNAVPIIKIDNISQETLKFMYYGRINLEHNLAITLHAESESFGVPSLKKFCREFFISELNLRNLCDILKSAERNIDSALKLATIEYIKETGVLSINLAGYNDLQKELPDLAAEIDNCHY